MATVNNLQMCFDFDAVGAQNTGEKDEWGLAPEQVVRITKTRSVLGVPETQPVNNLAGKDSVGKILRFTSLEKENPDEDSGNTVVEQELNRKKPSPKSITQIARERARGRHPAGTKIQHAGNGGAQESANSNSLKAGTDSNGLLNENSAGENVDAKDLFLDLDATWESLPGNIKYKSSILSGDQMNDADLHYASDAVSTVLTRQEYIPVIETPEMELLQMAGTDAKMPQNVSSTEQQYFCRIQELDNAILGLQKPKEKTMIQKLIVGIGIAALAIGMGAGLGKYLDQNSSSAKWSQNAASVMTIAQNK